MFSDFSFRSLLLLIIIPRLAASLAGRCPNQPAGRLEAGELQCPVPGRIGILEDEDNVISWAFPPRCVNQSGKDNTTRLDCLFTSTDFRNAHGISLVTSTTAAAHLIGIGSLSDRPPPLVARGREQPYRIVPVEGKGKGVVATRAIRRGEIIMIDVPAVIIGLSFLADTKAHHRRRILKQAIKQLPEETRSSIYDLYRSPGPYEVDAILGPNSNTVMVAETEVHVGLFTKVAVCRESGILQESD